MKRFYLPLLLLFALAISGCIRDETDIVTQHYYPEELALIQQALDLPEQPLNYNVELPIHVLRGGLFARQIDRDMATLGRVLFYEKALSKDGQVSCASCHRQEAAFADNKALSDGIEGNQTGRNSLALGSVVSFASYYGVDIFGSFGVPFLWDNRAGTAREQAMMALTSPKEMGLTMQEVVEVVEGRDYYGPLFRRAYGNTDVSEERILAAIAEFVDGLASFESRFDQEAAENTDGLDMAVDFPGFTEAENRGKAIYLQSCASCHSTNIGGRPGKISANNGLDMEYTDEGIGGFTGLATDDFKFKVPTLRNIALTGPYMHDGRFETLEEVVEFYSSQVADHPQLDQDLRLGNGSVKLLHLSDPDKAALVDFLETLTDENYLVAERYSDPFK